MVKKGAPMGEVDRLWGRRAAHGGAQSLGKKGRRELAPPLAILAAAVPPLAILASAAPPLALPEQEKTRGRSSVARGLVREGRRSPARRGGGAAARGRFQARCAAAATRGERRLLFLFRMGKEEVRFW